MKSIRYLTSLFLVITILVVPLDALAAIGVRIEIEDQTVDIGDQLTVEVVGDGEDFHAFSFDLLFDPNILQAVNAEYGGLLSNNGADAVKCEDIVINNTDGRISGITCNRATPDGVTGVGVLVKIIFDTVSEGETILKTDNVTLTNSTLEPIEFYVYEGEITVYPPNGKITGVVTGAFGPVRGADVVALQEGSFFGMPGRTDSDGKYIINKILEAGIYDVWITHRDYLPATISNVEVQIGVTTSDVNATLLYPTKLYTKVDNQGFIRDWLLLGPIPWDDDATRLREDQLKATEDKPGGAAEETQKVLTPREGDRGSGLAEALRWTLHNSGDRYINLESVYRGQGKRTDRVVTYAFTSVKVSSTQTGSLLIGSDEGIAIWLNHELVHSKDDIRGAAPDQDVIHNLTLKEGWNSILIKCVNGVGGWGFFARFQTKKPFTDPELLTNVEVVPESQELPITPVVPEFPRWDVNADGVVDISDLVLVGLHFGEDYSTIEAIASLSETGVFSGKTANVRIDVQNKVGFQGMSLLRVDIVTEFVENLYGLQFDLAFDPKVLTIVGTQSGDILARDGAFTYWDVLEIDNQTGKIIGATYVRKGTKEGINANGTLATIVFEVKDISISEATILSLSNVKLADADAHLIRAITKSALLNWEDVLIPEKSKLLQNYPNPFNPETWMPYQLAQDASVTIHIYDTKGNLIRTLHLGNRSSGVYLTKDKAVYWDGRDSLGEKVSSGVYFYTLQVSPVSVGHALEQSEGINSAIPRIREGKFRATRKMVIMK